MPALSATRRRRGRRLPWRLCPAAPPSRSRPSPPVARARDDRSMAQPTVRQFEPLIGEWRGEGEMPLEPPIKISVEAKIERLGEFIVLSTVGEPAEVPDSISIIGGAPAGEPQPMHYFDSRGVKRLFMTVVEG